MVWTKGLCLNLDNSYMDMMLYPTRGVLKCLSLIYIINLQLNSLSFWGLLVFHTLLYVIRAVIWQLFLDYCLSILGLLQMVSKQFFIKTVWPDEDFKNFMWEDYYTPCIWFEFHKHGEVVVMFLFIRFDKVWHYILTYPLKCTENNRCGKTWNN